jgi:HEAT repeat protein
MRSCLFDVRLAVACVVLLSSACGQTPPPSPTPRERTLQEWTNDLKSPDEKTRMWAAVMLGEIGPSGKPALPALVAALNDPNRLVRDRAVWALVFIDPTGKEVLIHLYAPLKDMDAGVRTTTVKAIGRLGPSAEPAIPELERLLQDPAPSVRIASAQALVEIGPAAEKSRGFLLDVSQNDRDPAVRQAAWEAAQRLAKD